MLEKLKRIISEYGVDPQIDMTIEECSEIIKALLKYRRKREDHDMNKILRADIIDEIADVTIMLEQLKIIYDCHKEVDERVDFKIDRQLKRIENGGV